MEWKRLALTRPWPVWQRDLAIIGGSSAVVFAVSAYFDLLNVVITWIHQHETWQLDELFTVFIFLSGAMSMYAFRRYRELLREVALREHAEATNARLVPALERAREDAASLRKILPVCPTCKRIRDTRGNWYEMETYLEVHYMTRVNDGLCPGCARDAFLRTQTRVHEP